MKKCAVIIAGCGWRDGTEISEATIALLALSLNNVEYEIFAPDLSFDAKSHLNLKNESSLQVRNSLEEASRIARGSIKDLKLLKIENFDGIVFPGGLGAPNILSKEKIVNDAIKKMHSMKKPIIAICIAPCLVSQNIENTTITYGSDATFRTGNELSNTKVIEKTPDEFLFDKENNIYTTPAFRSNPKAQLCDVFKGINLAISEAVKNFKE